MQALGMSMLGKACILWACFLSHWLKGSSFCVHDWLLTDWKPFRRFFLQCPLHLLWHVTELWAKGNVKYWMVSHTGALLSFTVCSHLSTLCLFPVTAAWQASLTVHVLALQVLWLWSRHWLSSRIHYVAQYSFSETSTCSVYINFCFCISSSKHKDVNRGPEFFIFNVFLTTMLGVLNEQSTGQDRVIIGGNFEWSNNFERELHSCPGRSCPHSLLYHLKTC